MLCSSRPVKKQKTQRTSFEYTRSENPPTHPALTQGDLPSSSLRMHFNHDENEQQVITSHRVISNLSLTDCCYRQAHIISEESSQEEVVRSSSTRSDVHSCESAEPLCDFANTKLQKELELELQRRSQVDPKNTVEQSSNAVRQMQGNRCENIVFDPSQTPKHLDYFRYHRDLQELENEAYWNFYWLALRDLLRINANESTSHFCGNKTAPWKFAPLLVRVVGTPLDSTQSEKCGQILVVGNYPKPPMNINNYTGLTAMTATNKDLFPNTQKHPYRIANASIQFISELLNNHVFSTGDASMDNNAFDSRCSQLVANHLIMLDVFPIQLMYDADVSNILKQLHRDTLEALCNRH